MIYSLLTYAHTHENVVESTFLPGDCSIPQPDHATQISREKLGKYVWGCGVVVSHALRMRKAPGSNPGTSTIFFLIDVRIES